MTIVIGVWVVMAIGFAFMFWKTKDDWGEK